MAQRARRNNNLEMKIGSKSEAGAMNETRLTSAKSAKSAVLISEFGLNESENKRGDAKDAKDAEKPQGFLLCVLCVSAFRRV
jgi:hypothetical protein